MLKPASMRLHIMCAIPFRTVRIIVYCLVCDIVVHPSAKKVVCVMCALCTKGPCTKLVLATIAPTHNIFSHTCLLATSSLASQSAHTIPFPLTLPTQPPSFLLSLQMAVTSQFSLLIYNWYLHTLSNLTVAIYVPRSHPALYRAYSTYRLFVLPIHLPDSGFQFYCL